MAMTQAEYDAMITRLEDFARREPSQYYWRVGLLAALGYLYILLILAVVVLCLALLAWFALAGGRLNFLVVKVGWILMAFAALVLRALWVTIPAPEGLPLTRAEAPRLYAVIDEISATLQAPRIHHVLIDDDFNAGVSQVPRLGPLGWFRNYLVLGLPLMQALSPEHFRAVLAHELGHLSGNHGRFGSWIYRLRATWYQLLERLREERRHGSFLFEKFLDWYAPFFNAYSFVLARTHEYEADRAAVTMAGPRAAGEALIETKIKAGFLSNTFWPGFFKHADHKSDPPAGAHRQMFRELRSGVKSDEVARTLRMALMEETGHEDTHPALAARLAALGYPETNSPSVTGPSLSAGQPGWAQQYHSAPLLETAAQFYLESELDALTARVEAKWKEEIMTPWRERHRYALASQQTLAALDEKASRAPLSLEEILNRALLTMEFKDTEAAIPLYREALAIDPAEASANYALGRLLLNKDDPEGIAYIEKAMRVESEIVLGGCEVIYWFLKYQGRSDEAEIYRTRSQKHYDLLLLAQQERQTVTDRDDLEPHGLLPPAVADLSQQLAHYPQIKQAYLARKKMEHFPEKPFYLLALSTRHPWYQTRREIKDSQLIQLLVKEMNFPGETCIVLLYSKKMKRQLEIINHSLIYQRS